MYGIRSHPPSKSFPTPAFIEPYPEWTAQEKKFLPLVKKGKKLGLSGWALRVFLSEQTGILAEKIPPQELVYK